MLSKYYVLPAFCKFFRLSDDLQNHWIAAFWESCCCCCDSSLVVAEGSQLWWYLGCPTPTTTMLPLLLFRVFLSWLLEKLGDSWLPSSVRPWQVSNGCQMKPSATVQAPNIEVADRNADNVNLFTLVWHISLSLSLDVSVCVFLCDFLTRKRVIATSSWTWTIWSWKCRHLMYTCLFIWINFRILYTLMVQQKFCALVRRTQVNVRSLHKL
jgi:hypothetical protein